jgi:TPR repeat protein
MASRTGLTLLRNARQGDAQAQLALGQVYLRGEHGLGKSHVTAYHWLEMAARAGLPEAWELIGREIPLDALREEAVSALPWYRRAAAEGVAPAQRAVGLWLLEHGEANIAEGLALLTQAAERDDVTAQERLGEFHLSGRYVPADNTAARAWLERAAAQNSMRSHHLLIGLFTATGDLDRIIHYARPLAEKGDAHASYALGMALLGRVPEPAQAGAPAG